MSIEAVAWVLNHGRPGNSTSKMILIGLANHADPEGTNAFPRWQRLAHYVDASRTTVYRHLIQLEETGWIRRAANQEPPELRGVPEHQRPIVYELVMDRPTPAERGIEVPETPSQIATGEELDQPDTPFQDETPTPLQSETTPRSNLEPPPFHSCATPPVATVKPHNRPSTVLSREGGVGNSPRTPASSTTPHSPTTDLEPTPASPAAADALTGEILAPPVPARPVDSGLSPLSPSNPWHEIGGSRPPLAADQVPRQYPERCLTHQTADWVAESCFACRDARQAVADARTAANSAVERQRRDALEAAKDARRRDIEHCGLCDAKGYLPGRKGEIPNRVCSHDADENDRRSRGLAAARHQLATAGGSTFQPSEAKS